MSTWLNSLNEIQQVNKIQSSRDMLKIDFNDGRNILNVYKNNKANITARELKTLITQKNIDFILCFNDKYCINEECQKILDKEQITYGNSSDFNKLLRTTSSNVKEFAPRETEWILNNLPIHNNVKNIKLIANRHIVVERIKGANLNLIFINEYELSNARINELFDYYNTIDIILCTNPNITSFGTINYRGNMVETVEWKTLFSLLNK